MMRRAVAAAGCLLLAGCAASPTPAVTVTAQATATKTVTATAVPPTPAAKADWADASYPVLRTVGPPNNSDTPCFVEPFTLANGVGRGKSSSVYDKVTYRLEDVLDVDASKGGDQAFVLVSCSAQAEGSPGGFQLEVFPVKSSDAGPVFLEPVADPAFPDEGKFTVGESLELSGMFLSLDVNPRYDYDPKNSIWTLAVDASETHFGDPGPYPAQAAFVVDFDASTFRALLNE